MTEVVACVECCALAACCTVCCGGCIAVGAIGYCLTNVIISPVGVPLYFYRKRKYSKAIEEWGNKLTEYQRLLVEKYIDGDIKYSTFVKIKKQLTSSIMPESIILAISDKEKEKKLVELFKRYDKIPKYLLKSLYYPCCSANTSEMVRELDKMLKYLEETFPEPENPNPVKDVNNEKDRYLINLLASDQKSCIICYDNFELGENFDIKKVYKTKCSHLYHTSCLENWCENNKDNPTCPKCRAHL
jgi:hypothetical protein